MPIGQIVECPDLNRVKEKGVKAFSGNLDLTTRTRAVELWRLTYHVDAPQQHTLT